MGQVQSAPGHAPTAPEANARRFRASSSALVRALGGAVLMLAVAAVVLSALIGQLPIGVPAGLVVVLTFAGVGLLIARRQPGNPIGWIMVVFSCCTFSVPPPAIMRFCITASAIAGFRWLRWPRG